MRRYSKNVSAHTIFLSLLVFFLCCQGLPQAHAETITFSGTWFDVRGDHPAFPIGDGFSGELIYPYDSSSVAAVDLPGFADRSRFVFSPAFETVSLRTPCILSNCGITAAFAPVQPVFRKRGDSTIQEITVINNSQSGPTAQDSLLFRSEALYTPCASGFDIIEKRNVKVCSDAIRITNVVVELRDYDGTAFSSHTLLPFIELDDRGQKFERAVIRVVTQEYNPVTRETTTTTHLGRLTCLESAKPCIGATVCTPPGVAAPISKVSCQ